MKHIREVGIRALEQNASAVVADVAAGETVTITDRNRPVAQLVPLASTPLRPLLQSSQARPAEARISDPSAAEPGPSLSVALAAQRDEPRS
jgi:prevent-host-death family protein